MTEIIPIEELTLEEIFLMFDDDFKDKFKCIVEGTISADTFWTQNDYDSKCYSELHNRNEVFDIRRSSGRFTNPLRTKNYICVNCRMIAKLVDIRNAFLETVIQLENGRERKIMIVAYQNIKPKIIIDPINASIVSKTRRSGNKYNKIIASDYFTNNIIITWILHNIFNELSMSFSENIKKAFICREYGTVVYQIRRSQLKSHVASENIEEVIQQLAFICRILDQYEFYQGNYSLSNFRFYKHGKQLRQIRKKNFRIIISLSDFSKSSITINKSLRIMYYDPDIDLKIDTTGFDYNDKYHNISYCKGNWFKVKYNEYTDYMFSLAIYRHIAEYNFYNYIIALCQCELFYNNIRRMDIWFKLWKDDEIRLIEQNISKSRLLKNYDTKRILSSIQMKIGILSEISL